MDASSIDVMCFSFPLIKFDNIQLIKYKNKQIYYAYLKKFILSIHLDEKNQLTFESISTSLILHKMILFTRNAS